MVRARFFWPAATWRFAAAKSRCTRRSCSAFAVSSVFLVSYLLYHYRVGHVAFHGQGWIRPVYFVLLTTHTILAVVIVPMILVTLRRAWLGKFDRHRVIARWTLPLWFYVSVTGVIVYLMVYQFYETANRT